MNKHAFLTQNLEKQLSDRHSGEEVGCTKKSVPPGLQKEGILQLEATQNTSLFPSKASLGGMYSSELSILEIRWVLWRLRSEPASPGGLEDTSPMCCASVIGYLRGKLCVGRVSPA